VALRLSAAFRQPAYRTAPRRWHAALPGLPLLAFAFVTSGCSISYQLDSLLQKRDEERAAVAEAQTAPSSAVVEAAAQGDLAVARAAVAEVLSKGGKHSSVPWENPKTGARGTITPLNAVSRHDGLTCRDFLASYVRNGSESWLQGEACRSRGKWEVRNLRPWSNT
jgi:DNA-binding transcriptional LysR family regulator